jgi:subtilisin family serine protease
LQRRRPPRNDDPVHETREEELETGSSRSVRTGSLRSRVVALLAFVGAAPVAVAQSAPDLPPWASESPELAVARYLVVQAPAGLVVDERGAPLASGPLADLDRRFGVTSVQRVHRTPPRGWRNPAAAARLGLERQWLVVFGAAPADLDAVAASYAAVPGVEGAWRDHVIAAAGTPNDTLFPKQWNLLSDKVDAVDLWDHWTDASALISVVDSGVDRSHPDLVENLWTNPGEIANNGIDDDGNGYVDDVQGWDFWNGDADATDDFGHGSHVAGILGARGNNADDVAGICWNAAIVPVKVLNAGGGGTWTSIAQGVVYSADLGAAVENYSLGGTGGDPALLAAVQYAASLDVVQVGAAGNNGNSTPYYPAAYDDVIAVSATDATDAKPGWSNSGMWVALCAPGDGIESLWKGGLTNILSGTSMAAPHVAGVAALIRSVNPQLDRVDVKLLLERTADDLGTPGFDADFEWGRLNAARALENAQLLTLSTMSAPPGSDVDLYVADALHPADVYVVQPTLAGREPGYSLSTYLPNDPRTVPIDPDRITALALNPAGGAIFENFIGTLSAAGIGKATFHLPGGHGLSGMVVYFSGFTVDPGDLTVGRLVLNSVAFQIE